MTNYTIGYRIPPYRTLVAGNIGVGDVGESIDAVSDLRRGTIGGNGAPSEKDYYF